MGRRVLDEFVRHRVFARDHWVCKLCGRHVYLTMKPRASIDHVKPVSRGGTDDPDNLQTACVDCNNAKGDSYDAGG